MKSRFSILFLIIVAVACCVAISTDFTSGDPALANGQQITITPPAGPPGTSVTIEGTGFPPGADYGRAIMLYGNITAGGSVTSDWIEVDAQGEFTVQGQIPWEASGGIHGIAVFFNPDNPGVFSPFNPNQIWCANLFTVTARELTICPDNGPYGVQVCLTGGGFGYDAAGEQPELWINYQRQLVGDVDDHTLNSKGDIIPAMFIITEDRDFHYGENIVEIRVSVGGQERSAMTTFDVVRPTLEIEPETGPRGTRVTATGSGWLTGPIDFLSIEYERADNNDKATVAVTRANADGDIWTRFTIPSFEMAADEINLWFEATDARGNESLKKIFTVIVPQLQVEPDAVPPGNPVTVYGKGFQPKTQVQEVSISGAPIVPIWELPVTSATGSFKVTGMVPGLPEGGHPVCVRVTQPQGEQITCPFTVTGWIGPGTPSGPAEIFITPDSGYAGDPVTIEGINFLPMSWIKELSINGASIVPVYELGQTSGEGSFSMTGTVPPIMPGSAEARVRVDQQTGEEVTAPFTILGSFDPGTPAGVPHITTEPDSAAPGEAVTVKGSNFTPLTQVQEVSIGHSHIGPLWQLPITSATGSFSMASHVPGIIPGGHIVRVRVTQPPESAITAPFTVTGGSVEHLTIKEGFKSIQGLYTTVWSFDSRNQEWQVYQPGLPPWVPVYDELIPGKGYWVRVTEDCILNYGLNTWELKAPWNLIGWGNY